MTNTSISYQDATLVYGVHGVGSRIVLLFHGFGQDHSLFSGFSEEQLKAYTIYSFDIFFHGGSKWNKGDEPINMQRWKAMLEKFLAQEKIDRFAVGGFSIGSRLAVAAYEVFSTRVNRLILIAPDAVVNDFWFRTATSNALSRALFKAAITRPATVFRLLRFLQQRGFISSSLQKFAMAQLENEEKRAQVYFTWTVLRKFSFNKIALSKQLNQTQTPVHFFIGRFDRVITVGAIENFHKRLKYAHLSIIETGHTGIVKACLPVLLQHEDSASEQ